MSDLQKVTSHEEGIERPPATGGGPAEDRRGNAIELFLPPSVRGKAQRIGEAIAEMQRSWPDRIVLGASTVSIFDYFPYLFVEAFPTIREADLDRFAVAARLYASSIFLHDKLFDQGAERTAYASMAPVNALRIQAMQWEAYRLLHELFPSGSVFWEDFRRDLGQFSEASIEEQKFVAGGRAWGELSETLALEIAKGKNGIARTTIAGLAELEASRDAFQPLVEAIDGYNVARQMLDDLCDWKEDLEAGNPTLLLARVLRERPTWADDRELSDLGQAVGRGIYYGGHAQYLMELAVDHLDRADRLTAELPDLTWRRVLADLRRRCALFLDDLERIVVENLRRAADRQTIELTLPAPRDRWQEVAWRALGYLVEQWHLGFGEARHIMEFPHELGFSAAQEYQRGDVFQRALVADVLLDAEEIVSGQLRPILDQEVSYLLSRRDPGRCGWRYFPDLPELPPDADDLAQILQVLERSGHRDEVGELCAGPLSILLEENRHPDGSFETWIIPASERTSEEDRQADFARRMWGTGPDPDVMANLLYALDLVDRDRYREEIRRGVEYLKEQQDRDGYWTSSWYHGPYYGTYVCLRLLARVSAQGSAIRSAADFVRRRQQRDGGWGEGERSNPLDTSFALLGLASLQTGGGTATEDLDRAGRALEYLHRCGGEEESWPRCELIRMELGRATGAVSHVLSYGSRTITTAFVLKAALAWHPVTGTSSGPLRASVQDGRPHEELVLGVE